MKIFHFYERYITRMRKCLSFPYAQYHKILLNSSISRSSRNEPKRLYTNTRFKTKKVKNHAISLLQMQRCPQYNANQEIKIVYFKDTLKSIASFFKTKSTQTKPQYKVHTLGKNLCKIDQEKPSRKGQKSPKKEINAHVFKGIKHCSALIYTEGER